MPSALARLIADLPPGGVETWARYYAGTTDLRTPLLSPLYAQLHGCRRCSCSPASMSC